ncbi:MAG TPA: ribonuclease III [Tepidiformaceae bacterium]|nr:ribonuclease III [Tepidiformaceae bacterium]
MAPSGEGPHAALVERLHLGVLPEGLLTEALTHASHLNESGLNVPSNERLEFLGDAVIGMVIATELFRLFPDEGEGGLTRMRADIVRGTTLAQAAARINLGDYMILGRGEETAGGRQRDRNLAGGLEALVGAVYRGRGYRAARSLVVRLLKDELRQVRRQGASIDAKSMLQHVVQARWHEPPEYVTLAEDIDGPARRFTVEVRAVGRVIGQGSGPSKRDAQQAAAREAVANLRGGGDEE